MTKKNIVHDALGVSFEMPKDDKYKLLKSAIEKALVWFAEFEKMDTGRRYYNFPDHKPVITELKKVLKE